MVSDVGSLIPLTPSSHSHSDFFLSSDQSCATFSPHAHGSVRAVRLMALSHCSCPDRSACWKAALHAALTSCQHRSGVIVWYMRASAFKACGFVRFWLFGSRSETLKTPSKKTPRVLSPKFWGKKRLQTTPWVISSNITHQKSWTTTGCRSKVCFT